MSKSTGNGLRISKKRDRRYKHTWTCNVARILEKKIYLHGRPNSGVAAAGKRWVLAVNLHTLPSICNDIQSNYIAYVVAYQQIPASTITYQLILPLPATYQYIPPHMVTHTGACQHIPVHSSRYRHIPHIPVYTHHTHTYQHPLQYIFASLYHYNTSYTTVLHPFAVDSITSYFALHHASQIIALHHTSFALHHVTSQWELNCMITYHYSTLYTTLHLTLNHYIAWRITFHSATLHIHSYRKEREREMHRHKDT